MRLITRDIKKLEYDATSQYRFHFTLAWFWFIAMPVTTIAFWPHTLVATIQLLIFEVSLWANFATHFGAMSSAIAAQQGERAANLTNQ